MKLRVAVATLGLVLASSAGARSFGEHGGYVVEATEGSETEANKGFCGMQEEFAGPGDSRLTIFRYTSNPDMILAMVDNYNWSTKEAEEYEVEFDFGVGSYERTAKGFNNGIHNGLMAAFPSADFLKTFAAATRLHVYLKGEVIDRLNMGGSALARQAFDRCWAYVVADEAAKKRERDKWSDLPKDPFSKK
jgi:hypothetical protein